MPGALTLLRGGFPAPAGMDPDDHPVGRRARGLPRARGDGPLRDVDPPAPAKASPRPRGWTLARMLDLDPDAGFPAPAGMDPD